MTTSPAPNQTLRTWREDHALTRAQMAKALNNTPAAHHDYVFCCGPELITRWESGRTRWPTRQYRAALHDLTGQPPAHLGFTPPPVPPRRARAALPPGPPTTKGGPAAVADLTALAAELRQRGYTTHLSTGPLRLTVGNPGPLPPGPAAGGGADSSPVPGWGPA